MQNFDHHHTLTGITKSGKECFSHILEDRLDFWHTGPEYVATYLEISGKQNDELWYTWPESHVNLIGWKRTN